MVRILLKREEEEQRIIDVQKKKVRDSKAKRHKIDFRCWMHVDQYSVRFILFICRKEGKEGNIVDFENKRGRKRKRDARGREGGGVGISLMITQCPQKHATSNTMATTLFTRQSREVICLEDKWSLFFSNFLSLTSLVSFSSLPLLGNLYLPFLSKTSPLLTHTLGIL